MSIAHVYSLDPPGSAVNRRPERGRVSGCYPLKASMAQAVVAKHRVDVVLTEKNAPKEEKKTA